MTSLIRIEWLKMRKYNAFWWIMGLTILSYPGINYMLHFGYDELTNQPTQFSEYAKLGLGNPFSFPEAWHTVTYFSSWFVFVPAVVIIMFISNEYTFKTHRQNIIDGWSRSQFVTSKLIDVMIITVIITVICGIIAFVTGTLNQKRLIQETWEQAYYVGLFALQTFAQLSIAFLIGFLVKKAFLALGIFLFYFLFFENIIYGLLTWKNSPVASYLPLEISDKLIPPPGFFRLVNPEQYQRSLDAVNLHVLLTIILTAVIWWICYRVNSRRDLK
jgi:ABC-2 type transport system permease protein